MENTQESEGQVVINEEMKQYLLESAKWGKFLAILGFIGLGLLAIFSLMMILGLSFLSALAKGIPMWGIGFIYLIMIAVYYFPTMYLYRFSDRIKQGVLSNDASVLTDGFLNLKKMFKFLGIMTIVILALYALILLLAVPFLMFFKAA